MITDTPAPALGLALAVAVVLAGCGAALESAYGEGSGQALKGMKASAAKTQSLKASADVLISGPRGAMRADAYVFYKAPGSLRIDLVGPLGNLLGVLVSRDGQGLLINHTEGVALASDDSACLLKRLLGAQVALPDLASLFVGQPPLIAHDESDLAWHSKGYAILTLNNRAEGLKEKIQMVQGPMGMIVLRAVLLKAGKLLADISFRQRGWKGKDAPLMPRIVEVDFARGEQQLALTYRSAEFNRFVKDDVFKVEAPPQYPFEIAECGAP